MNLRQKKLLKELMNDSYSTLEISKILNVTARTIRNDIHDINFELQNKGVEIIKNSDRKLELDIKDMKLFNEFFKENFNLANLDFTEQKNRVTHIALKFLFSNTYLKLDDFLEELFISKSTLQNDFKDVKELLKQFKLKFKFKPNYGIKLVGDENDIRKAISNLIYNSQLNNILIDSRKNMLLYDEDKLNKIYNIILKNIDNPKISLSDISLNNLVVHIAIAIRRVEINQYINKVFYNDLEDSCEYDIAQDIVFDIEKEFNIIFPDVEIYYITMHLMGTKIIIKKENLDNELEIVSKKFVYEVEKEIGYNISLDKELLNSIVLHLKPAIHRFKNNMIIRNPLIDSIKKNYDKIYEIVSKASFVFQNELNVIFNDDEVGYLAMHIAAAIEREKLNKKPIRTLLVCTTGLGSSQILRYKLERKFSKDLDIKDVIELYKLRYINNNEYDLIISTVPLVQNTDIPFIVISDILGETNFDVIKKFIDKKYNKKNKTYILKDDIYVHKDFDTKEQVIKFLCDELIKTNRADENLYNLIIKRETLMETCFGNSVAVPHPIDLVSKTTFLNLVTLKKPILWGSKNVQLVVLLNISKHEQNATKEMFNILINIIDDKNMVEKLVNLKSCDEIYEILNKLINN